MKNDTSSQIHYYLVQGFLFLVISSIAYPTPRFESNFVQNIKVVIDTILKKLYELKVIKSRKQIMASWILPKNERWDNFVY